MSIGNKQRFEILRRDGFRCQYCGRNGKDVVLEVDHIDPKANGGVDDDDNLITACFECNRGKRATVILPDAQDDETACAFAAERKVMNHGPAVACAECISFEQTGYYMDGQEDAFLRAFDAVTRTVIRGCCIDSDLLRGHIDVIEKEWLAEVGDIEADE